jgi:2-dehydropantoate 2-reductase
MMACHMPLHLVIVGAGAMGSVFGGHLAEGGVATTLLDVDTRLTDALARDGLRLVEGEEERTIPVRATSRPEEIEPPDAVLFFVKNHQTEAAAQLAAPLVHNGARAVSLQNGWGNAEILARAFGAERVVVGVTYTSATVLAPGVVRSSGPARTVLGPLLGRGGGDDLARPVAEALEQGGFPVERPEDVLTEVWKKLVLNAATLPTAALTGLTAGALAEAPEMRALVERAAAEAVEAGRAQGFAVDLDERLEAIHAVLARAGSGKGSMLQDVEAGRRTEIDVISGAVLRAAAEHDLEVPVTRALHALVVGLEHARGLGPALRAGQARTADAALAGEEDA